MQPSYKDMLKAHIMFSLTTNNMSLNTYVEQLIDEHREASNDILAAYDAVKRELTLTVDII